MKRGSILNAARVATFLRSWPTATNREIAEELGMPMSTVGRWAAATRRKRGIVAKRGPRASAKLDRLYQAIADVASAAKALGGK